MSRIDDELTEQFYRWELRGRGWQVFDAPVAPEPPFSPFFGHFLPELKHADTGRRHTFLSRLTERILGNAPKKVPDDELSEVEAEAEPEWREALELSKCQLVFPHSRSVSVAQTDSFLRKSCRAGEPLAFEIIGTENEIVPQFVGTDSSIARTKRALASSYPSVIALDGQNAFSKAWEAGGRGFAAVELGLGAEFMLPLGSPHTDILTDIVAALDALCEGEFGMYQVLFEPACNPWNESVINSVTDGNAGPFFNNRPELVQAAARKIAVPLFGVVVRLVARADDFERAWEIVADMAVSLSALANPQGNYLVPLSNAHYPRDSHEADIRNRLSRRSGMLLNLEELSHLVSLPLSSLSSRLRRFAAKTKKAPNLPLSGPSLILGENRHAGTVSEVCLDAEKRVRHMHVLGASGTGKSTFLINLIRQDIENGEGIAVLDPHGDLIDRVLGSIPPERIKDCIVVDASDEEYAVGFNILTAHSDLEKTLLASDLVSVFERLSTSWGDQMNSVLRNAILAFLESSQGGTLADLRRFLIDPAFRKSFLKTVADPEVTYYWEKGFPLLSGNRSVGPVLTRLDAFLSAKPVRRIVSQRANKLDFSEIMDSGKILLVKLSQGEIGRENAYLLGSLFVSKLQQTAMSRQRQVESERRNFWIYLDEFHHFLTPSMAEILSGARKYHVGLTLAHQELKQLGRDAEVESAVLSNPYTRVVFRVGDADARALEKGMSYFDARDLQNLGTGEAICRIERSDFDFNLFVFPTASPSREEAARTRQEVIAFSRTKYAITRAEAEASLNDSLATPTQQDKVSAPTQTSVPPPRVLSETDSTKGRGSVAETPAEGRTDPAKQPVATTIESRSTNPPPDLGRGGAQHQEIQLRLKTVAEALGYRAIVEKPVLGGQGSVDLVLEKGGVQLACEISVTTTIDHEIGNVRKCIKEGFPLIVVVCPNATRLEKLKSAVEGCFDADAVRRISFHSPDEFVGYLETSVHKFADPATSRTEPPEERRRGYKIKRSYVALSSEEMQQREDAAIKSLAETMRRTRKKPPREDH